MSNGNRATGRMPNRSTTVALAALLFLAAAGGLRAAPTEYPTGVTINNPDKAFRGWTLFNFMADKKVVLIDMDGNVINTWEYPTGNRFGPLGYPLPNGRILALCGNTQGRGICEMDWNGNLLWEFYHVDWGLNHDFERIPGNGNTIVLAKVDGLYPSVAPYQIRNDQLEEVTKDGDVVWSWPM